MFVYNLFNYFRSFRRVTPIFEGALYLLIYRYDLVQVALTLPISLAAFAFAFAVLGAALASESAQPRSAQLSSFTGTQRGLLARLPDSEIV